MNKTTWLCTLTLLCITAASSADTVIEFNYDNTRSQFLTNGSMARINSRGTSDYMIVNFKSKTIYSVIPDDKQITNLSSSLSSFSAVKTPAVRLDIKPAGRGPVIAGYNTNKYRLSANGEYCGTLFASKEALQGTTIEHMFGALKTMTDNHLESLGGFALVIPDCKLAKMRLAEKIQYIGAPMRVLDIEGNIESEITRIIKNAGVAPQNYAFPPSYRKVSMDERIDHILSSSTETEQKPGSKAEIRRKMRELRRSGKMTPETREQMRQYQQMLRRME